MPDRLFPRWCGALFALLPQFWSLLRLLLPGTLILALSLRDSSLAGAASRGLTAGGALLALLSLRTVLLLGPDRRTSDTAS